MSWCATFLEHGVYSFDRLIVL